jgi:hypothetical protein
MKKLIHLYRLINILSVDVAVGAVVGAMFFAKIFAVQLLPQGLTCLGLTVWIIYTADHLLDARNVTQTASSERHRFHQRYFRLLTIALIAAMGMDAGLLFFIRKMVFVEGLRLAAAIFVYLTIQKSLKFLKEVAGAILYTGGVLLIPWSMKAHTATNLQMMLVAQFVLTALINLLLFSWFDKKQDEQDRHSSFATVMGEQVTKSMLVSLFVMQSLLSVYLLFVANEKATLVLILMNVFLLLIFVQKRFFEIDDRYRLLGDAVFLLPLIHLAI